MKPQFAIGILAFGLLSSAAAQDVPVKKADALSKFEYTKYVASGRKTLLGFSYALNPDCSSLGQVDLKVSIQPEHGTVEVVEGQYYPNYEPTNPRAHCNGEKITGMVLYYRSNAGYTGIDHFDASSLMPTGVLQEAHFNVNVR
jgi:hypothetical protein